MTCVIGLISGTSVDGIDAAFVNIVGSELDLSVNVLSSATYPYPPHLRAQILEVCAGGSLSMVELAALDDAIAREFAQAAQAIQPPNSPATLIGSHGQTVYHRPARRATQDITPTPLGTYPALGYSLQLGRGDVIAQITAIKTISNFRVADIAAGGQGAPLVSKVDAALLSSSQHNRCIQNLGGIGNVTFLPVRQGDWLGGVCGWDTGPGNTLLDLAVHHFTNGAQTYDEEGRWAREGSVCEPLLEQWLSEEFYHLAPPKSTGREWFGWDYLQRCLGQSQAYHLTPADMLATLTELTVASIVHNYRSFLPQKPDEVLLCGGGSRNLYLKQRLQANLEPVPVRTTDEAGLNGDFKEAIAFAVLAYWREQGIPGNLPQVTGAKTAVQLGNIYDP